MSLDEAEKSDKIEKLYLQYELLSTQEKDSALDEKAYLEILSSVKGTDKEKKLVCQFIPTFFDRFPHLSEEALNAYLDLCEDNDSTVRKEAIKRFPRFFNGQPSEYSRKFADILSQLLVVEEPSEASLAFSSLVALLKTDPAGSLKGIFTQIKFGKEAVREMALKFLANRIRKINSGWSSEVQDILISEIKDTLPEACPEEIPLLFGLLLSTRLGKTSSGRKQILKMFLSYIDSDKESLLINDNYSLRRLISFIRNARVLFSPEIHSNKYFLFFCTEIIPRFLSFHGSKEGSGSCLWLLKLFAEITIYIKDLTDIDKCIENILALLTEFLPCPLADDSVDAYKRLQFSSVECLLSILHRVLKDSPNFLFDRPETLKDLRLRLLYFSRASRAYAKEIEETLKRKKKDMDRIKLAALRAIFNINTLIKEFFRNSPDFSVSITLSWISSDSSHLKRKMIETGVMRSDKIQKGESEGRQFTYKPPIGKYSQHLKLIHSEEWPKNFPTL